MRISEKERLTDLYHCLKAVPTELWTSSNYDVVHQALAHKNIDINQSISFHIFGRIAHLFDSVEDFIASVRTDALPAVKLSMKEAELLKAGAKSAAAKISKGDLGNTGDSLAIFKTYYDKH